MRYVYGRFLLDVGTALPPLAFGEIGSDGFNVVMWLHLLKLWRGERVFDFFFKTLSLDQQRMVRRGRGKGAGPPAGPPSCPPIHPPARGAALLPTYPPTP